MAFKSVLVHVEPHSGEGRLACAVDLANRFGGSIAGLAAEGIPSALANDPWGVAAGAVIAGVMEQVDADLKAAETRFEAATKGVSSTFRVGRGNPTHFLTACAASADLVVISLADDMDVGGLRAADAGEVIISAGRPVLFIPAGKNHLVGKKIVIAWKNTREARRAVADALPLLEQAEDVLLLVVGNLADREDEMALAEDVAANLRLHGVAVRVAWEGHADEHVAQVIGDGASRMGADLIVAGGYGRTRLGEWVFGGVTRDLLRQTAHFVLFSH